MPNPPSAFPRILIPHPQSDAALSIMAFSSESAVVPFNEPFEKQKHAGDSDSEVDVDAYMAAEIAADRLEAGKADGDVPAKDRKHTLTHDKKRYTRRHSVTRVFSNIDDTIQLASEPVKGWTQATIFFLNCPAAEQAIVARHGGGRKFVAWMIALALGSTVMQVIALTAVMISAKFQSCSSNQQCGGNDGFCYSHIKRCMKCGDGIDFFQPCEFGYPAGLPANLTAQGMVGVEDAIARCAVEGGHGNWTEGVLNWCSSCVAGRSVKDVTSVGWADDNIMA